MLTDTAELCQIASVLAAKGKGLLASDESTATIGKRLEKAGIANTEVAAYNELSFARIRYGTLLETLLCSAGAQTKLPSKLLHGRNWKQCFRGYHVQGGVDSGC